MGRGKTMIALTAAKEMIEEGTIQRVLITAPPTVANNVWLQETKEWYHLKDLSINLIRGTPANRKRLLNDKSVRINVISIDLMVWLVNNYNKTWRWDMVIVDESSTVKSHKTNRFRALASISHLLKSIVLMTGTPAANGILNLWSQLYLIDQGKRLGKTYTGFHDRHMVSRPHAAYKVFPREGSVDEVKLAISDVCFTIDDDAIKDAEEINITEYVDIPEKCRQEHKRLKRELRITLESGEAIPIVNAKVALTKMLQICNGAVYREDMTYAVLHNEKIKRLQALRDEYRGENLLVMYQFRSDRERLLSAFPEAVDMKTTKNSINKWNAGKIPMLIANPASCGHGLNLQRGGNTIIWFGMQASLEKYMQANARLIRQGQKAKGVRIVKMVCRDLADHRMMTYLADKKQVQDNILDFLKAVAED